MKLTIVIPVFNDTAVLAQLLERLQIMATQQAYELSLTLVDDGSTNDAWASLNALKHQYISLPITLIRLKQNQGQHTATLCGLLHAQGNVIVTLDADLQHPPEEIPKLMNTLKDQNADLVYGTAGQGHSRLQRLGSHLFKSLLQQLHRPESRHANSFRALHPQLLQRLNNYRQPFYSIDTALLALSTNTCLVATDHHTRNVGTSSYSLGRKIKLATGTLYYSKGFFRCAAILASLVGLAGVVLFPIAYIQTAANPDLNTSSAATLIIISAAVLLILKFLYRQARKKNHDPQQHIAEIVS